MDPEARIIGNDETDDRCSICGRGDWYEAVELYRQRGPDFWGPDYEPKRTVVCSARYEGMSCAALIVDVCRG